MNETLLWGLAGYLTLISAISAAVCVFDKHRARKGGRRIRERTLFLLSALGGAAAMYLAMLTVRHKTRKPKFMLGVPALFLLHILLFSVLLKYA